MTVKGTNHAYKTIGLSGERLQIILRRLRVVLGHGLFDAAREIINSAQRDFLRPEIAITMDTPLADTDFGHDQRTLNALEKHSILTVGELLSVTKQDLLRMRNVGPKQVKQLMAFRTFFSHLENEGIKDA